MTAANSTESMPIFNNFTREMANSTDSPSSLDSSTAYDYYEQYPDLANNWTARLLKEWYPLFWLSLGLILSSVVIYLSLFNKKHINGDYKWFILNQALASFSMSLGGWLFEVVALVGYGNWQFFTIAYSSSGPIWMTVFLDITLRMENYGYYAQMTTLLVTVLNRFIAIAFPVLYSKLMKPRLIVLYCILSYIVLIPNDDLSTHFIFVHVSYTLGAILMEIYELVPWLSSTALSVVLYCILSKRQRNMTAVVDQGASKESRTVLRAVLIEVAFTFFNRIFTQIFDLVTQFGFSYINEVKKNWFVNILYQISQMTAPMTSAFPCLAILITMRPYRQAVLSYLSPITKRFKCLANQGGANKIGVQTTTANRTHVITVRSVLAADNGGTALHP